MDFAFYQPFWYLAISFKQYPNRKLLIPFMVAYKTLADDDMVKTLDYKSIW